MVEHVLESMNEVISNEYNQTHQALDIVSNDNNNSDIIALDSGTVEEVVKNVQDTNHNTTGLATYGNYVKIKQNNGKSALYAHMEPGSVEVNPGDYVEKGNIIGTMGQTGNAYGNHLHLEIKNENGINENPIIELTTKVKESKKTNDNKEITDIKENEKTPIKIEEEVYLENKAYKKGSIVDGLKEIGINSSYDYRALLAEKNGITNYHGSFKQNVELLNLLKEGKLLKA